MIKANPSPNGNGFAFNLFGDSKGIRTPVIGVRGQRTNHYTIEPRRFALLLYHMLSIFATILNNFANKLLKK